MVPNTYAAYEWRRVSDNALVSSTNSYTAAVGEYKVMVTEQFGCSSNFSPNFKVISANGSNLPGPASNLTAFATSSTVIDLNWSDNPSPQFNETAFEIYRSTTPGGNYKLIAIKGADVLSHSDIDLSSNTKYYYIIRAINANGASAVTNEVNITTKSDITLPVAPSNLRVTNSSRSTISLAWNAASDDVGVYKYDVYINGVKTYATSNTTITASGLTAMQTYAFYVRARDLSGNLSPLSNQVSGVAALNGLYYKYYEGTWNNLPDFSTLSPVATGSSPNVTISPALRGDNFGFLWEGYINIPVTGSYTFETNSDDGSKLYIGTYNNAATALVNNDGLHGGQYRSGTITLNQGTYPIAITFFEQGGGESMNVYWTSTAAGILSRTAIPNSAFADAVPAVTLPNRPSELVVSTVNYKSIALSWTDNSNNETGFEIVRASSAAGPYLPIGTTASNTNSYIDSVGLNANTGYWYRVRTVSQTAQSEFIGITEGRWLFNNNYSDASGGNRTLTAAGSPTFNSADKKEGSHSISFTGTNQGANMNFSSNRAFPSNAYDTRTVSVWVKPTATTISSANKIIFDLGGSDNGLSLRFNSGTLQAGSANNNVRNTVTLNSVATDPAWVSNGWNNITVVYNTNTLLLYVNGVAKGTASLTYSSIGSTTGTSAIAVTNGSNAFNSSTTGTNYNGLLDDFVILKDPLTAAQVLAFMNTGLYATAKTQALPAVPASPAITNTSAVSPTAISLTFNDNSSNETGFEIHRSTTNNANFRLLTTVPAGTTPTVNFVDNDLFANTNYFYKVRAIGIGGNSAFSSETTAKTLNNIPAINAIADFTMRYASQKNIAITATDTDGDAITLSIVGSLPAFANFVNNGNGTGTLQFNPSIAQIGVYNISVRATDINNGQSTEPFTLTVNSNYLPVITPVGNVNINEGATNAITLAATDQDGNASLAFALTSGPSFATLTDNGNGSASISLSPGFAASGAYPVTFAVSDGAGGTESATFNITVANADPSSQKVYMSMQYTGVNAPAPWNNINSTSRTNLLDGNGQTTSVGIQFLGTPWNGGDAGANTGNNSGVYPDLVMRDYFWFGAFGAPETVTFNLSGLDVSKKYNVTLFSSSTWTGLGPNGSTVYTIGGVAKPLYAENNYQNTVTFTTVTPNASGVIAVDMSKAAGTPYGMVNSVVLEQQFDDGTTPVLPTNLATSILANGTVRLNWTDVAYNEDRYLVYRATNAAGPFTLLNPAASNANESSYTDNAVSSSTAYFYKIEATNIHGSSGQTDVVTALTTNKPPVLAAINDISLKSGLSANVSVVATDDAADVLTTTVTGLPSFAVYQSTGNGTGNISVNPGTGETGVYNNVIVKVSDNYGVEVSDTFTIAVTDPDIRSVYVNYAPPNTEGGIAQGSPWNNILAFPYANTPINNLRDDANQVTNFNIRLLEQWNGTYLLGMTTGYNRGIYPDNVLRSSIQTNSTAGRNIQIGGLDPSKRYNIVVFSSHNAGQSSQFTLSSGAQTVTSEARYNTNKAVQLNGLIPNASGNITVTMTKNASAAYLNLNALVIEEYNSSTTLLSPANLIASSILDTGRISLSWSDRSTDETGFTIWRSSNPYGTYTQIATTAANATSYTDATATANVRYFYKVRGTNGVLNSRFSNVSSEILSKRIVFINLNATAANNGPSPWNNTNGQGALDNVYSNLKDNQNDNSGVEMVITGEFNAPGFTGVTTNGVFPGTVMQSNYWTDAGATSGVQFNNLNIGRKYRIGIMGSAISTGYFMAQYTCNGRLVELNSLYNDSKVVYLTDLVPNQDGELRVEVRNAPGSPYCFTSAFTIESYDDDAVYLVPPVTPSRSSIVNVTTMPSLATENAMKVKVYPNPFVQSFTVDISDDKSTNMTLMLYDINNRLIFKKDIKGGAGQKQLKVNLDGRLQPGAYILQIISDGKLNKPVKLLKLK
jgi:hypothetical protein